MSSSSVSVIFDAPGPRGRAIGWAVGAAGVFACLVVGVWAIWQLRLQLLEPAKWRPFTQETTWVNYVGPGLVSTLQAALTAVVLAGLLGFLLGVGRLSHQKPVLVVAGTLVEFFRSVPVLMMMLFFYYVFLYAPALFGTQLVSGSNMPFWAVVLGLTFYNGAVIAELIRSGVHSLPAGQREAGIALGLSRGQTLLNVQLPQAITAMLPSLLSQLVVVVKDTALGYIVTYPDLLRSLQTLASGQGNILVALLVAAAIYIVLNYALTQTASFVERRMRTRRAGRSVGVGAVPVPGTATTEVRPQA